MKQILTKAYNFLKTNSLIIGISSLIWLILRSGTKPSRIHYPCQKAAAHNSIFFLGSIAIPIAIHKAKHFSSNFYKKVILLPIILILVIILGVRLYHKFYVKPINSINAGIFEISEKISSLDSTSSVFMVKDFPNPTGVYHQGLDSLLSLLSQHGSYFYKSNQSLPWCDTSGMIGKNDVVLIKVNAEWPERGMTNTDVLKGLIARIVAHPDTFSGEVCLVENGQWRFAWSYSLNNAEDPNQSMQAVMNYFANQGHHVTGFNWTSIGYGSNNRWVQEYDQGDTLNGYVKEDSSGMTYAKFKTSYGTRISTRMGIWDGANYDNDRIKFINVPVLKSHTLMGVSASIKHYIGFLSYRAIGSSSMHNQVITSGLLGVNMGKARFPDLNIIDATWVSAEITTGPSAPNNMCTRLNTLLASKDPVAVDYIAGKNILRPVSWWSGHPGFTNYNRMDPDNLNSENPGSGQNYSDGTPCSGMPYNAFHQYLVSTHNQLRQRGHWVTMDTNEMNVFVFQFPVSSIEDNKLQGVNNSLKVEVSENPFSAQTTIRLAGDFKGIESIKIYDLNGQLVKILSLHNNNAVWNGTNNAGKKASNGNYFVRIEDKGKAVEKKIILQR
jgi:hypothetical protein